VIEPVASAADPRLGDYAHVGEPAWLRARGLFVAEGRFVLRRLLDVGQFMLQSVLLTPAALRSFGSALDLDAPVYVAELDVLRQVTGFTFHRGCLALAHRPSGEPAFERFAGASLLLAIEGVGNPDNIGGLFRVAAAFGASGVLLDPASADPFYRKAVRTSMGAVLSLPFERLTPWPRALERFKATGFRILALTPAGDARALDEVAAGAAPGRLIVCVGGEGAGLSEALSRTADERVRIPISAKVDSLNVTVAAGIALSRLAR
jgi:tRNA G18 (ribose-2'-O)-methylase SpoU